MIDPHLNNTRVERIARLRRAENRARAYLLIGAIICAAGAAQAGWMAAGHALHHRRGIAAIELLIAMAALTLMRSLHRRRSKPRGSDQTPATSNAPDFSQLDNGSQRIEALQEIE